MSAVTEYLLTREGWSPFVTPPSYRFDDIISLSKEILQQMADLFKVTNRTYDVLLALALNNLLVDADIKKIKERYRIIHELDRFPTTPLSRLEIYNWLSTASCVEPTIAQLEGSFHVPKSYFDNYGPMCTDIKKRLLELVNTQAKSDSLLQTMFATVDSLLFGSKLTIMFKLKDISLDFEFQDRQPRFYGRIEYRGDKYTLIITNLNPTNERFVDTFLHETTHLIVKLLRMQDKDIDDYKQYDSHGILFKRYAVNIFDISGAACTSLGDLTKTKLVSGLPQVESVITVNPQSNRPYNMVVISVDADTQVIKGIPINHPNLPKSQKPIWEITPESEAQWVPHKIEAVGTRYRFYDKDGKLTTGKLIKKNPKNYKVITDVGVEWKISPRLLMA